MAVRPIVLYPDPILKKCCSPVDWRDAEIQSICDDLLDTMQQGPGVGIAAPQIGHAVRVAVVNVGPPPEKVKAPPEGQGPATHSGLLCLLNPRIVSGEGRFRGREGCLSIPEFTANVVRHWTIELSATDRNGNDFTMTARGFEAICIQHEVDHLDGLLFLDRVVSLKDDIFQRKGLEPRFRIEDIAHQRSAQE